MKTRVEVTYDGPINNDLDNEIRKKMLRINANWYGQGTNIKTGVRDLVFDLEIIE